MLYNVLLSDGTSLPEYDTDIMVLRVATLYRVLFHFLLFRYCFIV